jgi:SpoVK/Ycf46/Vps4 family AAA+-type ATPase
VDAEDAAADARAALASAYNTSGGGGGGGGGGGEDDEGWDLLRVASASEAAVRTLVRRGVAAVRARGSAALAGARIECASPVAVAAPCAGPGGAGVAHARLGRGLAQPAVAMARAMVVARWAQQAATSMPPPPPPSSSSSSSPSSPSSSPSPSSLRQQQRRALLQARQRRRRQAALAAAATAAAGGSVGAGIGGGERGEGEGLPLSHIGGAAAPLRAAAAALAPTLVRPAAAVRRQLGTPRPGMPLLCGGPGAGKTTVAAALARTLRLHRDAHAYTVWVCCRQLVGSSMADLQGALRGAYAEARAHAPALVVLDDVDAIAPSSGGEAGQASSEAARISTVVAALLREEAAREDAELGCDRQAAAAASGGGGGGGKVQLAAAARAQERLDVARVRATGAAVASVATCREKMSIHPLLRSVGMFDKPTVLPSLDAGAREQVMCALLRQMELRLPPPRREGAGGGGGEEEGEEEEEEEEEAAAAAAAAMALLLAEEELYLTPREATQAAQARVEAQAEARAAREEAAATAVDTDAVAEVARKTEGYAPGDLRVLLERAATSAAARAARAWRGQEAKALAAGTGWGARALVLARRPAGAAGGAAAAGAAAAGAGAAAAPVSRPPADTWAEQWSAGALVLSPADLQAACDGFVPAALRGTELFKSSVVWDDVGGLSDVQTQLKHALELPMKYARLYAKAPLKVL